MYDFHHNYIKKKYNNKARLLFTDSLTYEIEAEDIYKDFWNDKDMFDKIEKISNVTSNFFHVRTRLLNMTWSNLRFNV